MFTAIRRIALLLATSSGIIAATTLTAHALGRPQPLRATAPVLTRNEPSMLTLMRRIAHVVATSKGIAAATTLTAQAGLGGNHCETRLTG